MNVNWGYLALGLMLFIMIGFSPYIVSTALKQTKHDLDDHKKDKDKNNH